jgi:hypothetical protein
MLNTPRQKWVMEEMPWASTLLAEMLALLAGTKQTLWTSVSHNDVLYTMDVNVRIHPRSL